MTPDTRITRGYPRVLRVLPELDLEVWRGAGDELWEVVAAEEEEALGGLLAGDRLDGLEGHRRRRRKELHEYRERGFWKLLGQRCRRVE